jgi:hypothetical protein
MCDIMEALVRCLAIIFQTLNNSALVPIRLEVGVPGDVGEKLFFGHSGFPVAYYGKVPGV